VTAYQVAYTKKGRSVAHIAGPGPDASGQTALCGQPITAWAQMMPAPTQAPPDIQGAWCPPCLEQFQHGTR
jgi:hypothetical protein